MERDDYKKQDIPDTDEEEEKSLKQAWKEFLEAVDQGTQPEAIAHAKEKARLAELTKGLVPKEREEPARRIGDGDMS